MLIQFSVKNFLSFREQQTFSMLAAPIKEFQKTHTFNPELRSVSTLLHSSMIYGPNASGKSSLLHALYLVRSLVTSSAQRQSGDPLPVQPFILDENTRDQPSEFIIDFIADGVHYQYGFSVSKLQVLEEYLIAHPKVKGQRWFHRKWDESTQDYEWKMGTFLNATKQVKQAWQNATRNNSLFLSTAVQLNSKQLLPIYKWFNENLQMNLSLNWDTSFTAGYCLQQPEIVSLITKMLSSADIDIHDIKIKQKKNMFDEPYFDIKFIHKDVQGNLVAIDFGNESTGTIKLFGSIMQFLLTLLDGGIFVIDELENSLHPRIMRFLIELFHDENMNKKGAQLIFTTHDISMLNHNLFRRDQIWFCEKDRDSKQTQLSSLIEFHPRKGRVDLEKAYLSGRYGAIPFLDSYAIPEMFSEFEKEVNSGKVKA